MTNPKDTPSPQPPDGFASWLDFAVETFDTRGPWFESLFLDDHGALALDGDASRDS
jgi:hypothetical protein